MFRLLTGFRLHDRLNYRFLLFQLFYLLLELALFLAVIVDLLRQLHHLLAQFLNRLVAQLAVHHVGNGYAVVLVHLFDQCVRLRYALLKFAGLVSYLRRFCLLLHFRRLRRHKIWSENK